MDVKFVVCLFHSLGAPELIIIAVLILLLFGGKKIPELMRGLGKGVNSFKVGLRDMEDEVKSGVNSESKA
ncbi:MAG: twin-arginine translocase TatA/TatE family subunit [Prevotellaceae bacterium]|jgi:sec-independent protein translocase protein TatA|nr:twin-arginine translocase TatA/TatE family subunit [Prevotellaceae bacterium]